MSKTDLTNDILEASKELLKELYDGKMIRLIGIRVDGLVEKEEYQLSMFDKTDDTKDRKLDVAVDMLKEKYGYNIITRATDLKK